VELGRQSLVHPLVFVFKLGPSHDGDPDSPVNANVQATTPSTEHVSVPIGRSISTLRCALRAHEVVPHSESRMKGVMAPRGKGFLSA